MREFFSWLCYHKRRYACIALDGLRYNIFRNMLLYEGLQIYLEVETSAQIEYLLLSTTPRWFHNQLIRLFIDTLHCWQSPLESGFCPYRTDGCLRGLTTSANHHIISAMLDTSTLTLRGVPNVTASYSLYEDGNRQLTNTSTPKNHIRHHGRSHCEGFQRSRRSILSVRMATVN